MPDAAFVVDRDWRVIARNEAAARIGAPAGDRPDGTLLWEVWPELGAEPLVTRLREAMATRDAVHLEHTEPRPDGPERWLDVRATPYGAGLAILVRDLTRERRRESRAALLREITAALSASLDPAGVGEVIIEHALPALGANAGNVYLLDGESHTLVSVAAAGYAPSVVDRTRQLSLNSATMMADVARTRAPILLGRWEERVKRYPHHRQIHASAGDRAVAGLPLQVQGRTIGALSLAFPTDRDFDDDERGFIATVADLCAQALARTRLYEALRHDEAQARLITDRAPTLLAHINAEGRYLYVNSDFAERHGLTPEQIIGKRVPEIIGEAAYAVLRGHFEHALAGQEIEFEAEVPYATLGTRFVKISYAPNRDEQGRVRGVLAVIIDMTERQRAEQARQVLADAGAVLGSSLDPKTILDEVAHIAVRDFASHCVVWLNEDGQLRRAGVARATDAPEAIALPSLPEALTDPTFPAGRARRPVVSTTPVISITVPLRSTDRLMGALQFVMDDPVTLNDLWLADELGRRSTAALENSHLYRSLQESEARFRQLADAIPKIAWVIGEDGATLEYINRRWLDHVGTALASGATPFVNEHIHPEDRRGAEERWAAAHRAGQPFTTEFRLRTRQGYRWFLCRNEPVLDAAGHVVKWFGAATDIDDTKRAEASQRFLAELSGVLAISLNPSDILHRVARLVIPTLADYCFFDLVQADGEIRRVAWAHVDPREQRILDEHMARLMPDSFLPGHPITRTIETGEPWRVSEVDDDWIDQIAFSEEHRTFVRARGLRSRLSVPLRARGRVLGALTLCFSDASGRRYGPEDLDLARDVAERIAFAVDNARLYTESREAEAKVRRLLDAGVVGVVVADAERVLEANDHFLEMIGYSREELERGLLRWSALTPPDYQGLDARALAEMAETGIWTPYEKEYNRRDGSRIPILIGGAVLERDPLKWICFILDLTEQKRGEDEWRAFIDATAHDLRNPLTSVLGQAQLLQRRLARDGALNPADVSPRLAAITASTRRAASLIDDLIDTARLRAGQPLEMRPAPLDFVRLVSTCADEARRVSRSHALRVDAAVNTLRVVADGPRIERVVRNMLDNAIKFSPNGGEIIVRVAREDLMTESWAVLTIEDRGLGIPEADLDHVFDQFRRGANVEGRIHGSGIGLSGARQIVTQHGGEILVHSEEGEGSTFTLRLPIPRPAA